MEGENAMPRPAPPRDAAVPPPGRIGRALARWRRRIGRFARSPSDQRRLAVRAVLTLAVVRVALLLLPLRTALRMTGRVRAAGAAGVDGPTVRDIAQAVRRASRAIPGAACLPQALAGDILMARAGHDVEMRIGVGRHPERGFEAHAWLEHDGEVVLGELPDLARYSPMPSLQPYLGRRARR
jgi:hypothetical protein